MKHLAPVIRTTITSLQAGLPARITVFNAEPENEVELVAPESYYFGGSDIISNFPAIEVAIPDTVSRNFSIGQVEFDVRETVIVAVTVERFAAESELVSHLYELAAGYGRVVLEVLLQPDAFGTGIVVDRDEGVTSTYGANPELRDYQTFKMMAVHRFTLDDEDSRP